jgi:hypothetical protein
MWFLRRKARIREKSGEPLSASPAPVPMRRIEITVEREWISRASSKPFEDAVEADEGVEHESALRLPKPPDG